jgi:aspartate-semialdehyde dehydrogenase
LDYYNLRPGVVVQDDPSANEYPMPSMQKGKMMFLWAEYVVTSLQPNTLNCWIVADNLRKGAATNACR